MTLRHRVLWTLAVLLSLTLLMTPALWDGFPLIFPDTGSYLTGLFEGRLNLGRSAFYGLFLDAGMPLAFWPNVVVQAALTVWLIFLSFQVHGLGARPGLALGVVAFLAIGSSLPWIAGHLLPDILFLAAVLALHLLIFRSGQLAAWERYALAGATACAIVSHIAAAALCVSLLAAAWLITRFVRPAWPQARFAFATYAVAAGIVLGPISNSAITGTFAFTPGGLSFLLGRILENGIVARYLNERCPDPALRLCDYKAELPDSADTCGDTLCRSERIGLIALIAVSSATHSATFAVLLGLVIIAALHALLNRKRLPPARLGRGLFALALGAALVFGADDVVAGRLVWTPGGFALSFGRMLQDGIVQKYLDRHCPDPALRLCAYKDQLPHDADVWFWGSDLFDRLGRFAGLEQEMQTIAVGSVIDFPALQIETAAAAARQLVAVHAGEGVLNIIWHTYSIIQRYTPQLVPAMRAARQQQGEISFTAINALQYPLALLSMALMPVMMWLAWRKELPAPIGELAAMVALTLLGNAVVCGAFANPHDRYGARVAWLATLVVVLALAQRRATRLGPPANSA